MVVETEVEALRRELAEMRQRLDGGEQPDAEDLSIKVALREYEQQYFSRVPSLMDAPCAHQYPDGRVCGQSWKVDNDTIRSVHRTPTKGSHSYQVRKITSSEEKAGSLFHISQREMEQYGVEPTAPKTATDTYLSEKQASKALKVTLKELRAMVVADTLVTDKIGDVTLVRRESVDRVLQLAQMAREAEGYDEDA